MATFEESERKVLKSLAAGPKTWEELLKETGLSTRTLSKRIKSLLEKGLITEEIDKKDRRKKIYRLASIDPLREDLITINLLIWMERVFYDLWNEYINKEKLSEEDILEYFTKLRLSLADFLLLCYPDDIAYYVSAINTLTLMKKSLLDEVKNSTIEESALEHWQRLKSLPPEELFKRAVYYLKMRMRTLLCQANTPDEEIKRVLQKYLPKESLEEVYQQALKQKREAKEALEQIKRLWIYPLIKINEAEIPSYEEYVKAEGRYKEESQSLP